MSRGRPAFINRLRRIRRNLQIGTVVIRVAARLVVAVVGHELNDLLFKIAGHFGYMIRPSKRRQGYGKVILRLGLEQARKMGLKRVLVTCDENNIGSKKVIEYNGGQFENEVCVEGSSIKKLRYWIDLT